LSGVVGVRDSWWGGEVLALLAIVVAFALVVALSRE
jgi:hypothetical protein